MSHRCQNERWSLPPEDVNNANSSNSAATAESKNRENHWGSNRSGSLGSLRKSDSVSDGITCASCGYGCGKDAKELVHSDHVFDRWALPKGRGATGYGCGDGDA